MSPLSAIPSNIASFTPKLDVITPDIRMPDLTAPSEISKTTGAQPASDSFASMFGRMVSEVNAKQNAATEAVTALQSGQKVPLHQTVIAMEEASVSFQLMVEVRNKLLESYQEIMRMSV